MGKWNSCFPNCWCTNRGGAIAKSASNTRMNIVTFDYSWTISNISMHDYSLESPVFHTGGKSNLQWRLTFNPVAMSVSIVLLSPHKSFVIAKYTLFIVTAGGRKSNARIGEARFDPDSKDNIHYCQGFPWRNGILERGDIDLPNDELTILCKMSIADELINILDEDLLGYVPDCQMPVELYSLFMSQKFCDVAFNVDGEVVGAHKAILGARSPVFMTMFEADMLERKRGQVIVDDIEFFVFMDMLTYIYTCKAPNIDDMADGLLAAADKYDLQRLKAQAEVALAKTLEVHNVAQILIMADLYQAHRLKRVATDFINLHMGDVLETYGFKQMAASHPLLTAHTLNKMAKERNVTVNLNKSRGFVKRVLLFPFEFRELDTFYSMGLVIALIISSLV